MRFDLRTIEGAKKFLCDWLNIDEANVMNYVRHNDKGIDVDEFCKQQNIYLNEFETDNIRYVASHVTTCLDGLESIKKYGLMDLTSVLSLPTPINDFLKSYEIEFDTVSKTMKFENKLFDVSYDRDSQIKHVDRESLEGRLKSIGHKLYYDNQLTAFLTMEGDKKYGGYVHLRPEFLLNVSKVCKKDLEKVKG